MDDIRNHDATPTPTEREWMAVNPWEVALKSLVFVTLALSIGVTASLALAHSASAERVAVATSR